MDPHAHRAHRAFRARLDRHLARTGADEAAMEDQHAANQLTMLRWFLDVAYSACDDERVPPDVTARVLDRVIYGCVPQRPAVEQRVAERARMVKYMRTDYRPIPIVVSPDVMERLKTDLRGGRADDPRGGTRL